MNRRTLLGLLGLGALAALGAGGYGLASAQAFRVSRFRRKLRGLQQPLRVVQLSDLHMGQFHGLRSVSAWVKAANREQPDVVLITGDFVDGPISDSKQAALAKLETKLGIWGVLGNHDYFRLEGSRQKGVGTLVGKLKQAGIQMLINQGVQLRPDLFLAGVDDLWHGNPNIPQALAEQPANSATLLMCHNPDLLPNIPASVSLILCGHTHGGQVCLPGGKALHVPSEFGTRFSQGFFKLQSEGFVCRGLGTTGPPVRTFCPAELVVFDFEP